MLIDRDRVFVGNIYKKTGEYSTKLIKENVILIQVREYLVPLSKIALASDLMKMEMQIPLYKGEPRVPEYYLEEYPSCYTNYYVEDLKPMALEKAQIKFVELKIYEYVPLPGCECF